MDCSTFDWTAFDAMINLFDTFIIGRFCRFEYIGVLSL